MHQGSVRSMSNFPAATPVCKQLPIAHCGTVLDDVSHMFALAAEEHSCHCRHQELIDVMHRNVARDRTLTEVGKECETWRMTSKKKRLAKFKTGYQSELLPLIRQIQAVHSDGWHEQKPRLLAVQADPLPRMSDCIPLDPGRVSSWH